METRSHYGKLALALSINAVIMYLLSFSMIDRLDHFYNNVNFVYMALMMVAPMALVMLAVMRSMYAKPGLNIVLYGAFAVLFIASFAFTRTQTPVGDVQFLRSMIPHHSGAILMCQRSALADPEVVELCGQIVKSQEDEIAQMKRILARY